MFKYFSRRKSGQKILSFPLSPASEGKKKTKEKKREKTTLNHPAARWHEYHGIILMTALEPIHRGSLFRLYQQPPSPHLPI